LCAAVFLLVVFSACAATVEGSSAWRTDSVWDDGNAEFCAYEVDWFRYGRLNPGRALMILVKEPWAPDLDVKADQPRSDGFDVIKLNHVRDVPTGIYTYHQMASTFIHRQTGTARKLMATSSEGCGISTARMTQNTLHTSSYFDGQGDRSQEYPAGVLSEDGLAMTLRDYVAGETPESIDVFPSLMAGRFPALEPASFRLERRARLGVEVPAGSFDGVEIRLTGGDEWQSYVFAVESPHLLLEMTSSDGTTYRLNKCERIPYWSMNVEGGEAWLPEAVR
jgi:hypothetical protein